jgi:hypothetical protein
MSEDNRRRVEDVRHALGELLDRLAKAVVDGLTRSKMVGHPTHRRSEKPPTNGAKSSE